jgi:gamma-butyrobetaine dioxygenase
MSTATDVSVHGLRPLTPDFYDYEWNPIVSAELRDGFVTVAWADGAKLACYALWLAENSPGFGLNISSREGVIEPSDLPHASDLAGCSVDGNGALMLTWSTREEPDVIHPGWLRHVADDQFHPRSHLPKRVHWTAADFSEPPTVDATHILDNEDVFASWLTLLATYGLARLKNAPTSEDFLQTLIERIGPVRGSNFGKIFDVRSLPDPTSTAYTTLNLGQHTDLPTRETPPGFQFLHCVRNEVEGGWSRMSDGLAVTEELRLNHPEDYEALTTLNWVFFNRQRTEDHRWEGPIIDLGGPGQPLTLRAFYPVRGFPAMAAGDVPRAYAALRRFSSVAHDPRFQIKFPFEPGDIVGFDNRVGLHGRDAFQAGTGERHLRGCYLDHDDLFSRLRVLNRRRGNPHRA